MTTRAFFKAALLGLLGGFSVFFVGIGIWLARKIKPRLLPEGSKAGEDFLVPANLTTQLPALSAACARAKSANFTISKTPILPHLEEKPAPTASKRDTPTVPVRRTELGKMEGGALATPEAPVRLGPGSQGLAPPFIYAIGFRFRGGE